MNKNWIPFEIRIEEGTGRETLINLMPEEDQDILICTESGNVRFDTMMYDCDGYYLDSGYGIGDEAIAWMPLPEPYRGDAPTIEAEPVKHGKWIIKNNIYPVCSECGKLSDYECDGTHKRSLYCPNCGAKMDA